MTLCRFLNRSLVLGVFLDVSAQVPAAEQTNTVQTSQPTNAVASTQQTNSVDPSRPQTNTAPSSQLTNSVQFIQPAPYSRPQEIGRRFGFAIVPPDYDLSQERFRIELPSRQETNRAPGILVWLSPGDDGYFPPTWQEELSKHNLILVAPLQAGDQRHPIDRLRVALDGTCNVCRKYRIDRKRIYVGGFAGGARMASMLGIGCGDIFTGTLCICGVNFHLHVPVNGTEYYPGSFYPSPEIVQYARTQGRFVLITGEGDPESDKIRAVAGLGFPRDGFKNVTLQLVPGIGQTTPAAATLEQALAFLDASPAPPAPRAQAPRQ